METVLIMFIVVILVFALALGVIYAALSWGLREKADNGAHKTDADRKDR